MYMRKRLLQDMSYKEREREKVMPFDLIRSRFLFETIYVALYKQVWLFNNITSFLASP